MRKVKWGIMGPGGIAHKFAKSLISIENAELTAIGSRNVDRAEEFAAKYGAKHFYGSYEELVQDKEVEIVYVATPHSAHFETAMLCLKAGKAVLCEKPFTINATQAQLLVKTARECGVFLMEAMWTRYLPAITKVRELLAANSIGKVRMVKADFGFRADLNPDGRLFNPNLGGGALLDVGIYTLSFTAMILGVKPQNVISAAHIGITGVDEQCTFTLSYEGGELAVLSASVRTHIPNDALILGTDGYIKIPEFWHGSSFELNINGKSEMFNLPYLSNGYTHEAQEAMECLVDGRLESSIMPLDETIELMRILDGIRCQWGLKYPQE